jgi:hypothetical protein
VRGYGRHDERYTADRDGEIGDRGHTGRDVHAWKIGRVDACPSELRYQVGVAAPQADVVTDTRQMGGQRRAPPPTPEDGSLRPAHATTTAVRADIPEPAISE